MIVTTSFNLGFVTVTPSALDALAADGLVLQDVLDRHTSRDWGDAGAATRRRNDLEMVLNIGFSVRSAYILKNTKHHYMSDFWIIVCTDKARNSLCGVKRIVTQVLTCDDYAEEYRLPPIV